MNRYEQNSKKKLSPIVLIVLFIILTVLAFWLYKSNQSGNISEIASIHIPEKKVADIKIDAVSANLDSVSSSDTKLIQRTTTNPFGDSAEIYQIKPELSSLENSDAVIRRAVQGVSEKLTDWFQPKEIIRKYIIIINDLSQKQILIKHRHFLKMPTKVVVKQDSQGLYLAPESYKRFDPLANAIAAINVQQGLALYLRFKPLFQQVYDKFGYPEEYKVDDIFIKAAASVIDAPVINGRVALIPHAVRFKYADKKLEGLNDVKKLMLRMGPGNTQKIQVKLRQMVEAFSAIQE